MNGSVSIGFDQQKQRDEKRMLSRQEEMKNERERGREKDGEDKESDSDPRRLIRASISPA